jgi:hypothetical protein
MSACRKMTWASRADAKAFVRDQKRQNREGRADRPYWCETCEQWHLTSQSKTEARRRGNRYKEPHG